MLNWAIEQKDYPVAIRVPSGKVIKTGRADKTNYSDLNKFKIENKGDTIAIIAAGNFYKLGKEVQEKLKKEQNINATLINPVYLSGIDKQALEDLKKNHRLVITLEDGCLAGGYGEKISRYYANSNMKCLNYGAEIGVVIPITLASCITGLTPIASMSLAVHTLEETISAVYKGIGPLYLLP